MYLHFICRVINLYCWQVKTIILCVCSFFASSFLLAPSMAYYFTYIFLSYTLPFFFSLWTEHGHTHETTQASIMFAFTHYYYYLPSLFIRVCMRVCAFYIKSEMRRRIRFYCLFLCLFAFLIFPSLKKKPHTFFVLFWLSYLFIWTGKMVNTQKWNTK